MKKKKKKKKGKIIAAGTGLEGFVDLVDPNTSDPTEEWEDGMSSLATGFSARMWEQGASAQRETTPGSEVSGKKHPK